MPFSRPRLSAPRTLRTLGLCLAAASLVFALFPAQVALGAASGFEVTGPVAVTTGVSHTYTITAMGPSSVDTGYTGTALIDCGDPAVGVICPVSTAAFIDGVATVDITLITPADASISAIQLDNPDIYGGWTVKVGALGTFTHLVVAAPATATVGVAAPFTVTAEDDHGTTDASVNSDVTGLISATDGTAAFTPSATPTFSLGVATASVTFNAAGSQTVRAEFDIDPLNYLGYSDAIDTRNNQTISSDAAPSPGVVGGTFVPNASALGGTVVVTFDGGGGACTLDAGPTITFTGLGTCTVYMNQAGSVESGYWAATQVTDTITVKDPTTSSIVSVPASPGTTAYGDPVTLTVTVTSVYGTPATGSVQFKDGGSPIGSPVDVNGSGVAVLTTRALPQGSHTITATYGGDSTWAASNTGSVSQNVGDNGTSTTVVTSSSGTTSPASSAVGESVTFTAAVSGGGDTPTGTVQFYDNGDLLGSEQTLVSGQGSVTTSGLAAGTHMITAEYSGDANYGVSTSADFEQDVNKFSTTTVIGQTFGTSTATYGQTLTWTATVSSSSGTPTGSVDFFSGGTDFGTFPLVGGVATFSSSTIPAGSYAMQASYVSTLTYGSSSSGTLSQTINTASTTTTISCDGPSIYGADVLFTAYVTSTSGAPTGTVTFYDDGVSIGNGTLSGGVATLSYGGLEAGSHTNVTASYASDGNFAVSSSDPMEQDVSRATTTTTVSQTGGDNPSTWNAIVTFTAHVASGAGVPVGSVTFYDNGTKIGNAQTLDGSGDASVSTSSLSVGTHSNITASFAVSTDFAASDSAAATPLVVDKAVTTTTLSSDSGTVPYGTMVTFTAHVTSGAGALSGTVEFTYGATDLGGASVVAGYASVSVATLPVGDDSIKALYSGDSNFGTSKSVAYDQVISAGGTSSTTLSSGLNASTYGVSVTFTATVTGAGDQPIGEVWFYDGATKIGTGTLTGDQATFSTSDLTAGHHNISAVYQGDTNYDASTSNTVDQQVNKGTPTITWTSINPSPTTVGASSYTLTTTSPSPAARSYSIDSGSTPDACTILVNVVTFTGAGTCVVDADQPTDGANWNAAAQVQQSITVTLGTVSFLVSATSTATAGTPFPVTITAKGGAGGTDPTITSYTGTVTITCTDGAAVFPVTFTFLSGDNGVHIITVTLKTVAGGTKTVTATDASITGTSGPITVNAGATTQLIVTGITSPQIPGAVSSVTVTTKDTYGNVTPAYTGTVHFSTTDAAATVPGNYAFVGGDAGVHTFASGVTFRTAGARTITATDLGNGSLTGTLSVTVGYPSTTYFPISPARVLDTRPQGGSSYHVGIIASALVSGTVHSFNVAAAPYVKNHVVVSSPIVVPADAVAVTGNLTVAVANSAGVVEIGPYVSASDVVNSITFGADEIRANNITVGLNPTGGLQAVFRGSGGATCDIIFDVTGYFLADTSPGVPVAGGAKWHAVTPGRVLDTRPTGGAVIHMDAFGSPSGDAFQAKVPRNVKVAGVVGIGWSTAQVPSNASAVTGNVTVTNSGSIGYVSFGPTIPAVPDTSTLNTYSSQNTANGITVALNAGNLQGVWVGLPGTTSDVIFDVTGYFTTDGSPGGQSYHAITPLRMGDTTTHAGGLTRFAPKTPQTMTIGGLGEIPSDASGISGNLTLAPSNIGYAFISPVPVNVPGSSTVNVPQGHIYGNGFDVKLSSTSSGKASIVWVGDPGTTADITVDVTGYWK